MAIDHQKARLAVIVMFVLVVLGGLLTGGMTYGTNQWFGGQRTIHLGDGTEVGLWLDPSDRHWDVPFLAHYQGSTPPYTLQIWIPDPDPAWESVEISEVSVDYEGGTKARRTGGGVVWRRTDGEMALWSGPLKDLVELHESCTISVTGSVSTRSGETSGFSFSHKFEAEPDETFFAPYWWVLGQGG